MTSRDRARRGAGLPALALLVGLLAAGLIGMHQLSGGDHHAMSNVTAVDAAHHLDPAPLAGAATTAQAAVEAAGGPAGACVAALLVGLLVLVARTGGWAVPREPARALGPRRTGGPRPGRGPPRDLLAQLCVLRT